MTKKLFSLIPLVLIFFVAIFLRWWHIASVAPGISTDEVDYSLSAKSFYLTGSDLKNTTRTLDVLRFKYPVTDDTKAELPYLIQMPLQGPFPFSLPLTRLPFVLMSLGTVFFLFAIAKELVNKSTAYAVGFLAAINPFLVVLGRTNYEVTGAAFFYLAALFAMIKLRGWHILFSVPLWMCAFYVYIGTKLLFIPFFLMSTALGYFYINKRKFGPQYLTLLAVLFTFVGVYFLILHATPTNRLGELLTPNSKEIVQEVNAIRHNSMPAAITSIFINKYTIYLKTIVNSFFLIFSTDFLVTFGDNFFRVLSHGVLYYIDIVFLLIGTVFLAKKNTILGFYIGGFLLIASIPQIFHAEAGNSTNSAHASMVFPFLVLLTGIGVGYTISFFKKKWMVLPALGIGAVYLFSLLFFFQAYFYQYPLLGKDAFTTRELSKYITLATKEHKKVIVLSPVGAIYFKKYLYYANALNTSTINDTKHAFISGQMQLGNVSFASCSNHPAFPKDTIVIEDMICGNPPFKEYTTIALLADGGIAFKLYSDSICSKYSLKQYPTDLTLDDLRVENESKEQFCKNFVTH